MTTTDDRLLADIGRRNWLILGGLVLLSLFFRSVPVTLGVAGGGLVTLGSYHWLHGSLAALLHPSKGKTRRGFLFTFLTRMLVLTAALYLLLVPGKAHPAGMMVGVSVVVINLMWTTLKKLLQDQIRP